jgi:hypothetical protein
MACCALKKQKKQWMIIPLLLFLLVGSLGGLYVVLLSIFSLGFHNLKIRRDKSLNTLKELMKGLSDKILHEPFLFDPKIRCQISGRMMHFSAPFAAGVYKYFNIGILALILVSIWLLGVGLNIIGI